MDYSVNVLFLVNGKEVVYKNVVADGIIDGHKHRYLILGDNTRLEIPMEGVVFEFDDRRAKSIEVNRTLQTNN